MLMYQYQQGTNGRKKCNLLEEVDLASASALTLSRADEYSDPTRHARATAVVLPPCVKG